MEIITEADGLAEVDHKKALQVIVDKIVFTYLLIINAICKRNNVDDGHGAVHAYTVMLHTQRALVFEKCTPMQQECVLIAALMHDIDDHKFFPFGSNNAARLLQNHSHQELILRMIDLVSCSQNGNSRDGVPHWMLIPRDADRLEAVGKIGIIRCIEYTRAKARPMHTPETPLCFTIEEFWTAAKGKYDEYLLTGKSASMQDHCLDKLPHMFMATGNFYIDRKMKRRNDYIPKFYIQYSLARQNNESDNFIKTFEHL
jgi:uncharacterized protein